MAFQSPPTYELREEWRRIGHELKRRLVELSLDAAWEPGEESAARRKLREEGVSEELVNWLLETADKANKSTVKMILTSRISNPARSRLDRFNSSLITTILLLVSLIWLRQEFYLLQSSIFPIGLLFAGFAVLVLTLVSVASWRKWLQAMRGKPGPAQEEEPFDR